MTRAGAREGYPTLDELAVALGETPPSQLRAEAEAAGRGRAGAGRGQARPGCPSRQARPSPPRPPASADPSSAAQTVRSRASGVMPSRPRSSTHQAARPRARASSAMPSRPTRNSALDHTSAQAGSGAATVTAISPLRAGSRGARVDAGGGPAGRPGRSSSGPARTTSRRHRSHGSHRRRWAEPPTRPSAAGSSIADLPARRRAGSRGGRGRRRPRGAGRPPRGQHADRPLATPSAGRDPCRCRPCRPGPAATWTRKRRARRAGPDGRAAAGAAGGRDAGSRGTAPALADPLERPEDAGVEAAAGDPPGPVDGRQRRAQAAARPGPRRRVPRGG